MAATHHPGLAASGTENETGMQEREYSKSHNFGTSSKRDNKQEKLAALIGRANKVESGAVSPAN